MQRSASCGQMDRIWPIFVNKILLEHSHSHSSPVFPGVLCDVMAELIVVEETVWPTKPKISTGPLQNQSVSPWTRLSSNQLRIEVTYFLDTFFILKFQVYEEVEKLEQKNFCISYT